MCIAAPIMALLMLSGCQMASSAPQQAENVDVPAFAEEENKIEDPVLLEVYGKAEALRAEILSSKTEIQKSDSFIPGETYTGTAYYISNTGSDSNDGLSVETAFATLAPLEQRSLSYGDAVFFERGSTWRAMELPASLGRISGVTYSAYGVGEKPKIYGSEENGSGGEKWTLHHSDDSGKKIWLYYRDMTEVGAIALNGEIPVHRDIAYWDHGQYFVMDKEQKYWLTKTPYSVEDNLPDMYCFPALIYPETEDALWNDELSVFRDWEEGTSQRPVGKLYFRCDEGNPGELYNSIEFMQPYSFAAYMEGGDTVLDNLCISYSCLTIGTGDDGWVVQNCEIGWGGGAVCNYSSIVKDREDYLTAALALNYEKFGRRGGTLSLNNSGSTARNNYVHHAFQEGISLETFDEDIVASDVLISGNLVEKCNQALLLCNWEREEDPARGFKNLLVENNLVLDTAVDSLYNAKWEYQHSAAGALTIQGGPNCHDGSVFVRDNVFAMSEGPLIVLPQANEYMKVFSNNTYIQKDGGAEIIIGWDSRYSLKDNVATLMGDEAANVVLVK